ncbi:hypothetical protein HK101_000232, partial [Irineochytrium annulatum]
SRVRNSEGNADLATVKMYKGTLRCPRPGGSQQLPASNCGPQNLYQPLCLHANDNGGVQVRNWEAVHLNLCHDPRWCLSNTLVPVNWAASTLHDPKKCIEKHSFDASDTVALQFLTPETVFDVEDKPLKTPSLVPMSKEERASLSLTDTRCEQLFPNLYQEIDKAKKHFTDKGIVINRKFFDNYPYDRWRGMVRGIIYENQVYVVYEKNPVQSRGRASLLAIQRALDSWNMEDEPLPNVEFMLCSSDDPCSGIWGYTKRNDMDDVWVVPDYGFYAWPDPSPGYRGHRHMVHSTEPVWSEKIPKLIYRGAHQYLPARLHLLKEVRGKEWSDVMELKWGDVEERKKTLISMPEHCLFKYTLHTEGVTHSGRLKFLLNCLSATLIPKPIVWKEFFYGLLKDSGPEQNYFAVKPDYSDLDDRMNEILGNDTFAQEVAGRAIPHTGGGSLLLEKNR